MSNLSAASHPAPQAIQDPSISDRDTLEAIDDDFLRDQLAALMASPTLSQVADRHSEGSDDPADFDSDSMERDTLPSVDTQLLREALNAGLLK